MRKQILTIFLFFAVQLNAQVLKPVKWDFEVKDLGNKTVVLFMKATLDNKWNIYSQNMPDGGPIPTSFTFNKKNNVTLEGKVKENGHLKKAYDENFEMDVLKYANEVSFEQTVKINGSNPKVEGFVTFMTCDDSRCLPPEDVSFSFDLSKYSNEANSDKKKMN
jgi:hypothetical protein